MGGQVGVEAADDQQGVDLVALDGASQGVELFHRGDLTAGAQLGPAVSDPALDVVPGQGVDVAVQEPGEAAVDAQHGEVVVQTQTDGGARGGVHARGQAPGVDDRHPARAVGP